MEELDDDTADEDVLEEPSEDPDMKGQVDRPVSMPTTKLTTPKEYGYESLRPHFLWGFLEVVKCSFKATSQQVRNFYCSSSQKLRKLRSPALKVKRQSQVVANVTVFSDEPAIDERAVPSQLPAKREEHAKRWWQTIKDTAYVVLNRTIISVFAWHLHLLWLVFVLTQLATPNLKQTPPMDQFNEVKPDFSPVLHCFFWWPVHYNRPHEDSSYSGTKKKVSRYAKVDESMEKKDYVWKSPVCRDVEEEPPHGMAAPFVSKPVVTTPYVDVNFYNVLNTGRAITQALLVSDILIEWFPKRQAQVETATHGTELAADRIATEQANDLCATLRYLEIEVTNSYKFENTQAVVTSTTTPEYSPNKSGVLSCHRVMEVIVRGAIVVKFPTCLKKDGKRKLTYAVYKQYFLLAWVMLPTVYTGDY
jgi:hypothetical protein